MLHELHVQALTHMDEGPAGTLVVLDRIRRTRSRRPAPASPAVRVLVADGQALVRAGFRALLDVDGRTKVVAEATTGAGTVPWTTTSCSSVLPDVSFIEEVTRTLWTDLTSHSVTKPKDPPVWANYHRHVDHRNAIAHGTEWATALAGNVSKRPGRSLCGSAPRCRRWTRPPGTSERRAPHTCVAVPICPGAHGAASVGL